MMLVAAATYSLLEDGKGTDIADQAVGYESACLVHESFIQPRRGPKGQSSNE